MAYSVAIIMLTTLLIGTAIAQPPAMAPDPMPPMGPGGPSPMPPHPPAMAPIRFAPGPSPVAVTTPVPSSHHAPAPSSHHAPAPSSHHAPAPSPSSGQFPPLLAVTPTSPASSTSNPTGAEAPAPSAAVSNRVALGTFVVGLIVISLVA